MDLRRLDELSNKTFKKSYLEKTKRRGLSMCCLGLKAGIEVVPRRPDLNPAIQLWVGVRDEAGLPDLPIHHCRHTGVSQDVMNGVGLPFC